MGLKRLMCLAILVALSATTTAHAETRFAGGTLGVQPDETIKKYRQNLDFVWFPSFNPASYQLFADCRVLGTQAATVKGTLKISNINLRGFDNETDIAGPDLKVKVKKGEGTPAAAAIPLGPHADQTGVVVTAKASWRGKINGGLVVLCELDVVEFK